jgi:hypothetical protein
MGNPAPFDLNRAVMQWREQLATSPAFRDEDLDELENHLRDSIASLELRGLNPQEAFWIARHRLGGSNTLQREFGKVNAHHVWLHRALWMVTGYLGIGLLAALSALLLNIFAASLLPWDFLSGIARLASPLLSPLLLIGLIYFAARSAMNPRGLLSRVGRWAHAHPISTVFAFIGLSATLLFLSIALSSWTAAHWTPEGVAVTIKWHSFTNIITGLLWPAVLGWLLLRTRRDQQLDTSL